MSDVSKIYDALLNKLDSEFSSKTRIPNPYSLGDNIERLLIDGYGVLIGEASSPDEEFNQVSKLREFQVVFTRQIFGMESDPTKFDAIQKALLEDIKTASNLFCQPSELDVESIIDYVELGDDSGIEFVQGEKFNFISSTQTVLINYRELIS